MTDYNTYSLAIDYKNRLAYVFAYDVVNSDQGPALDVYNVDTLALLKTLPLTLANPQGGLGDLKFDSFSGTLYAVVPNQNGFFIGSISTSTGAVTQVASISAPSFLFSSGHFYEPFSRTYYVAVKGISSGRVVCAWYPVNVAKAGTGASISFPCNLQLNGVQFVPSTKSALGVIQSSTRFGAAALKDLSNIQKLANITGANQSDFVGRSAVDLKDPVLYIQTGDVFDKRIVALLMNKDGSFSQRVVGATVDGDVIGAFAAVPRKP